MTVVTERNIQLEYSCEAFLTLFQRHTKVGAMEQQRRGSSASDGTLFESELEHLWRDPSGHILDDERTYASDLILTGGMVPVMVEGVVRMMYSHFSLRQV